MTTPKVRTEMTALPRLLRRFDAAHYLAVSVNTFDKFVALRPALKPKLLDTIKVWDVRDLNAFADDLPYADGTVKTGWEDFDAS